MERIGRFGVFSSSTVGGQPVIRSISVGFE